MANDNLTDKQTTAKEQANAQLIDDDALDTVTGGLSFIPKEKRQEPLQVSLPLCPKCKEGELSPYGICERCGYKREEIKVRYC